MTQGTSLAFVSGTYAKKAVVTLSRIAKEEDEEATVSSQLVVSFLQGVIIH